MKIALVNPQYRIVREPASEFSKNVWRRASPVLSLGILASKLVSEHDVLYLDSVIEGIEQTHRFDNYTDYYGLSVEEIKKRVDGFGADQVWMTCLTTSQYPLAECIARALDQPVVIGGNHVSLNQDEVYATGVFRSVVSGEVESAVYALTEFEFDKAKLPKPSFLTPTRIDYSVYPLEKYWTQALPQNPFSKSRKAILFETSRGCPEKCCFCSTTKFFGNKWRPAGSEYVVGDIADAVDCHGVEEVQFCDDSMGVDRKRFMEICEGLKPLNIHLCNPSGIRFYTKKESDLRETYKAMADAGFYQMTFAVESGNEDILNGLINKRLDLDFTARSIAIAKEYFKVHIFLMMGLPGETREQIQDTIDYAKKINADSYSLSLAQPFPKTELYDMCMEQNLLAEGITDGDMLLGKQVIKRDDGLDLEKLAEETLEELNMADNMHRREPEKIRKKSV